MAVLRASTLAFACAACTVPEAVRTEPPPHVRRVVCNDVDEATQAVESLAAVANCSVMVVLFRAPLTEAQAWAVTSRLDEAGFMRRYATRGRMEGLPTEHDRIVAFRGMGTKVAEYKVPGALDEIGLRLWAAAIWFQVEQGSANGVFVSDADAAAAREVLKGQPYVVQ